jgi:hypothetical protein
MTSATELTAVYDRYLRAVTELDNDARGQMLAGVTTDDVEVISPTYAVKGRDAVAAQVGKLLEQINPPLRMERLTDVDGHHGWFRAGWRAVTEAGDVRVVGQHVFEVRGELLARILVFLGPL